MKTVRTVYLSGPMSGIEDFNFPAFNAAAERWRKAGWFIINPAEEFDGRTDLPREQYIRRDIENLLLADGIALLPGWKKSKGALLEVAIAIELGLAFFNAETMAPIEEPLIFLGPNGTLLPVSEPEPPAEVPNVRPWSGLPNTPEHQEWVEKGRVEKGLDDTLGHVSLEADKLVYGDRNASYGHPYDDYLCTSRMWEAILLLPPGSIGPEKAALMMALMKVSRASRKYKRDNYVDLCGYAECANRIHLREEGKE